MLCSGTENGERVDSSYAIFVGAGPLVVHAWNVRNASICEGLAGASYARFKVFNKSCSWNCKG
jgi:hypothetical protein